MRGRPRVAGVGTRGQAERVAVPTIAASQPAVLAGVVGSSPERTAAVADRLGVRSFPSLEALAEDAGRRRLADGAAQPPAPDFDTRDLSSLPKGNYGASAMPVEALRELQRRLPEVQLWNF